MSEIALDWYKVEPPDFDKIVQKPGIYIISTKQEATHTFEVKYVGQTTNLNASIKEHWSKKEKNKDLRTHIAEKYAMKINYAIVESPSDREGMELYLYDLFDPPFRFSRPSEKKAISCTVPAVRKHS